MTDGLKKAAEIFLKAGAIRVITGHIKKTEIFKIEDLQLIDQRGAVLGSLLIIKH